MSISALNAGVSGLNANQRALDVSAHNVANVGTAGFQPQAAAFQESSPAGGGVSLSVEGRSLSSANPAQANGVDVAKEITDALVYEAGVNLSAKVVKTADATLGSLLDIRA
ncbi:flagellar basal body protein [Janthinobacterium fluminis]|uniref:Flagellar basal body protein n=1 Tax=Janthinobacterium fluminis TaxID=2987524 RepID=A0ABT5JUC3_9BURK|nr:flagellar basal body protein [Janthinobacterium fluminis]MDC8756318.1 flagellar basal body protein [Janthinobacterium fluminis]